MTRRHAIYATAMTAVVLASCGKKEATQDATADAANRPYTGFEYSCTDGLKFSARIDKGDVVLTVDGQEHRLPADTNTSGAHYSGDNFTFIAQGKDATLIRGAESARSCSTQ